MSLERSAERDAAIDAIAPLVGRLGWSLAALREAAGPDADLLFPGGVTEMVEVHSDLADRRMVDDAGEVDLAALRTPARVRALIAMRLHRSAGQKEAIRRGLGHLALPGKSGAAARVLARTVDTIWTAAGDTASGPSRYTKRLILAGVYSATLLYWLREGVEAAETLEFLDRRLAGVARLGRRKRSVPA